LRAEAIEQSKLFRWAKEMQIAIPQLSNMFAIPNGAYYGTNRKRAVIHANSLKSQGLKKGVPDIFLAIPARIRVEDMINNTLPTIDSRKLKEYSEGVFYWHGLFMELKVGKNKLSPEQIVWLDNLRVAGYYTAVCFSFNEAKDTILRYLSK
jgi:hypothetical protein